MEKQNKKWIKSQVKSLIYCWKHTSLCTFEGDRKEVKTAHAHILYTHTHAHARACVYHTCTTHTDTHTHIPHTHIHTHTHTTYTCTHTHTHTHYHCGLYILHALPILIVIPHSGRSKVNNRNKVNKQQTTNSMCLS